MGRLQLVGLCLAIDHKSKANWTHSLAEYCRGARSPIPRAWRWCRIGGGSAPHQVNRRCVLSLRGNATAAFGFRQLQTPTHRQRGTHHPPDRTRCRLNIPIHVGIWVLWKPHRSDPRAASDAEATGNSCSPNGQIDRFGLKAADKRDATAEHASRAWAYTAFKFTVQRGKAHLIEPCDVRVRLAGKLDTCDRVQWSPPGAMSSGCSACHCAVCLCFFSRQVPFWRLPVTRRFLDTKECTNKRVLLMAAKSHPWLLTHTTTTNFLPVPP
jgi:hypothetical protein